MSKYKDMHEFYTANLDPFAPPTPEMMEYFEKNIDKMERVNIMTRQELDHILNNNNEPHILDSGTRREFETGAVRDIQEGKGRCDLMPLDVVAHYIGHNVETDCVLKCIYNFQETGALRRLYDALDMFADHFDDGKTKASSREIDMQRRCTMCLEVAIHFEEGAKKYGEDNWHKGIPTHCYTDSAVRHYLKFLRGDTDEPHDRAFVWNILCCIWTCKHKPELNVYNNENVSQND